MTVIFQTYTLGHYILELLDILINFSLTKSEMVHDKSCLANAARPKTNSITV